MSHDETQGKFCSEENGFTNPSTSVVPCQCKSAYAQDEKCSGHLKFDAVGRHVAFLICDRCGCCYVLDPIRPIEQLPK